MRIVNASIITIGDELLIGQTIDTNSAFIARELNKIGVWVRRRVAVGDDYDDIWEAMEEEGEESDIIIITGGLGPTADDITKPLLCDFFGGRLVVNEEVLAHVRQLFEKIFRRPGAILERNLKQAEVPDNCIVLHNARGTAPGMWFRASGPPAPRMGERQKASPNPGKGEAPLNPERGKASPNPSKGEAPLNPPQGGTLDSVNFKGPHQYRIADPAVYGMLKKFVYEHRSNSTEAEKKLWEILKGRKMAGFKFRRQHIIGSYIADFVCIPERLIIEVDGLIHQVPENKASDEERTKVLNRLGFDVIRFTNEEVLLDTDLVINKILLCLKKENLNLSDSEVPPSGGFRGAQSLEHEENPPLEGREAQVPPIAGFRGAQSLEHEENPPLEGGEAEVPPSGGPDSYRDRGASTKEDNEAPSRRPVFISLPGVPHEMKGLMMDQVIPRILNEFTLPAIVHRTAFTAGQGESVIAEMLKDFEPSLPSHIKLAYLPNYGMVKLRLTAKGNKKEEVEKELQPYFDQLQVLVEDCLVTNEDEGLEVVIGKVLKARNKTMGTAESCTGGYIAHLITSVPGSSAYFKGSVVGYANEVKENILGVSHETLGTYGAVSEETVKEMITASIKKLNVDYVLATSGIMGPGGGSPEKPVGTVWIAAGNKDKVETQKLNLRFDRERNISMTSSAALNFLRKFILSEP